jgi:hypothetical protein
MQSLEKPFTTRATVSAWGSAQKSADAMDWWIREQPSMIGSSSVNAVEPSLRRASAKQHRMEHVHAAITFINETMAAGSCAHGQATPHAHECMHESMKE